MVKRSEASEPSEIRGDLGLSEPIGLSQRAEREPNSDPKVKESKRTGWLSQIDVTSSSSKEMRIKLPGDHRKDHESRGKKI